MFVTALVILCVYRVFMGFKFCGMEVEMTTFEPSLPRYPTRVRTTIVMLFYIPDSKVMESLAFDCSAPSFAPLAFKHCDCFAISPEACKRLEYRGA